MVIQTYNLLQPPSGGCVLKPVLVEMSDKTVLAAAFGRLCVETCSICKLLCATRCSRLRAAVCWNYLISPYRLLWLRSRLRAAVCWNTTCKLSCLFKLCSHLRVAVCWNIIVEILFTVLVMQPPSGGCVLKLSNKVMTKLIHWRSHLRVAVCWNKT